MMLMPFHRFSRFYFALLLILLSGPLMLRAQKSILPRYATEAEQQLAPVYTPPSGARGIPQPPASPVRTPAEWEEVQTLVIAWEGFTAILRQIVAAAQTEAEVIILCSDSNQVKSNLTTNSIPLTNLTFIEANTNSVWIRDYGPWSVYTNDVDSLLIVDWIYNRPRPWDDLIPGVLAGHKGVPHYEMTQAPNDLVHTGGNFMTDGLGTGFSSRLVLSENWNGTYNLTNKTEAQIDSLMEQFLGIHRYPKMSNLPYDAIHHIDMHMKLLDEETLLVGQYPAGTADGPQIEANLQYLLSNFNSAFGTPYKVVRIPMPPDQTNRYPDNNGDYRTFTNSVFVNKTIIVPIYEYQYDTTVLRIYRQALPGYKVAGIDADAMIWAFGAIHCITKLIATPDPLLIVHQPLSDTMPAISQFQIDARIRHRSGIQQATVYYTTDTAQVWQQATMTLTNTVNHTWTGYIPGQMPGERVFYYIEGQAVSGKQQVRPLPAPAGWWDFYIDQPVSFMEHEPLHQGAIAMQPAFPNPASAITCIPVVSVTPATGRLAVTDLTGRHIATLHEGEIPAGKSHYFIHAGHLAVGAYVITLQTEQGAQRQKLIVR